MRLVLEHNRMDVASLLTLLCRLCHDVARPETLAYAQDVFSCGRLHARAGRLGDAERCFRAAGNDSGGLRELSALLKRQGRHAEATELWRGMLAQGGHGVFPYEELAKHLEHRETDYGKALEIVEECMVELRAMGFLPCSAEYLSFARRRQRLELRLNGRKQR
jgi:hypothetical protein